MLVTSHLVKGAGCLFEAINGCCMRCGPPNVLYPWQNGRGWQCRQLIALHRLRRYVTEGKRISFRDETKLGLLSPDDEAAAVERRASSAAAGPRPPDFHFICEVQPASVT